MKKITAIEIAILFIAGLIPLLWLRSGYIISNGDGFPFFLNPHNSFRTDTYLWSCDFLGSATPWPALAIYQYFAIFLTYLGLSVGYVQIFFQTFLFMLDGFSMYYFSKTLYPELKFAGFAAAFFYMFNFFALDNRNNVGFVWVYAFLPLLLALFVKIANATVQKNNKTANKNIIYFALVSVVAFSFASINPANLALMGFGLGILVIYYLVKFRSQLRGLFVSFGKIAGLTIPINLWWIIPILNYYFLSSQAFNSTVSVDAWSWTHARASFLNLFWLNGFWGWLPENSPQISFYSNPIIIILVFAPFLVAASALLFKGKKSRFNAYVMGAILVLLFLAKGLHEPFSDLLIYQNISLMSMFREAASKFTLLIVPFLALLIGYAVENLANVRTTRFANVKMKKIDFPLKQALVVFLVLMMFAVSVYPLIINPIETKTQELPFSSYVKIPDYWYQATNWINIQQGDGKVLITPLDDFYQMPYNWTSGYYGTDQLIDSLIDKPIVSTASLNGYKISSATDSILEQLNYTMFYNNPSGFKALLDLLGVQFILQRNDVEYNFTGRNIMSPIDVQAFFAEQPYLRLVERFGQLDIYQYTESKPSFYPISLASLQQSNISIENKTTFEQNWNFSFAEALKGWAAIATSQTQNEGVVSQKGNYLNSELSNSTEIKSPLLSAKNATNYLIQAPMSALNVSLVQIEIVQYDANMNAIHDLNYSLAYGNNGFLNWTDTQFTFGRFPNAEYFTINYVLYTNQTSQGTLMLSNVNVTGQIYPLNTTGIDILFNSALQNQTAAILKTQNLNPTKIVVTVNASQPFILATTQAFDGSWVAYVDGAQAKPTSLYLGLQGFAIEKTGQFQVTLEYKPQLWFYYASAISTSAVALSCLIYLYISRDEVKSIFKNLHRKWGVKL